MTFPLRHQAALPAVSRCPQAGPGASAAQPAGRLPTAGATKALRLKTPLQPRRSRLQGTIYQCPDCETRYLAEQWCPDCSRPCQRLGAGGICPCCEEMITVEELTEDTATSQPLPAVSTPVHH
jgi:hypothetical protein